MPKKQALTALKRINRWKDPNEIYGILPKLRSEPYDMKDIILRLVDNSEFDEYKEGYGQTILTGYARIEGWAVGIVANQAAKWWKLKKGKCNLEV